MEPLPFATNSNANCASLKWNRSHFEWGITK